MSNDRLLSLRAVAVRLSLYKRDGETPNPVAVRHLGEGGQIEILKISPKTWRVAESELHRFIRACKKMGENDSF